jgi:hypothetical protein
LNTSEEKPAESYEDEKDHPVHHTNPKQLEIEIPVEIQEVTESPAEHVELE